MAAMLIYYFGVILDLVPTFGFRGPSSWILPAVTIGLVSGSKQSRLARVKLEETMTRPYVLTAMSKGFGRERILFRDALPKHRSYSVNFIWNGFRFYGSGGTNC